MIRRRRHVDQSPDRSGSEHGAAVEVASGVRVESGDVERGGHQVDLRDQRVDGRRLDAGTAHDERDARRLLVGLALAQEPVLAQQVAVVGDEEDPRPPELAGLAAGRPARGRSGRRRPAAPPACPRRSSASSATVLRRQVSQPRGLVAHVGLVERRRVPGNPVEVVGVLGARRVRPVRGGRREHREPRPGVLVATDEAAQPLGGEPVELPLRVDLPDGAVDVHPGVVDHAVEQRHPAVPAGGDVRRVLGDAVHVLAEVAGVVAGRLDPGRRRVPVVPLRHERLMGHVAVAPVVVGVATGQDRGARRPAQRHRAVPLPEAHPLAHQPSPGPVHRPQRRAHLVVRDDPQDVVGHALHPRWPVILSIAARTAPGASIHTKWPAPGTTFAPPSRGCAPRCPRRPSSASGCPRRRARPPAR